ncbi:ATP-binding cassette domain-containing protein [Brachybacterium paraconglomeratum]|uniref:ATP-binding cassette domain-containing protein n=1 Tax=Brachybacterium paraconglomeratum TaxID=173362 RepID=UPI002882D6B6|nr:ATP-binding cassette domain-containing protein [Brachybacterium paraconglomeratum]
MRRADERPRPSRPAPALRHDRELARDAPRGQPRRRAAEPHGRHRRAAHRKADGRRRTLRQLPRAAGEGPGGGRAGPPHRRAAPADRAAAPRRGADGAGPPTPLRPHGLREPAQAQDDHEDPGPGGAGLGGEAARTARRRGRRGPGAGRRARAGAARRRPDPHRPAGPGGPRRAAPRPARGRPRPRAPPAGPLRVALTGRNGIGKTRLLRTLVDEAPHGDVRARSYTRRIGMLPQRLDHLGEDLTVLEAVRASAPATPVGELRAMLARFLLRGDAVERRVGDLSGGERFRVALAGLVLADPPRELLVLDEPTNSLDLGSIDALVDVLSGYRGGLLVVSHDEHFLARLGLDARVILDEDGLRPGQVPAPSADGSPRRG